MPATNTAPATKNFTLVNNSGCIIDLFYSAICAGIRDGSGLPEEIADLFTLEIRHDLNPDGSPRGILRAA